MKTPNCFVLVSNRKTSTVLVLQTQNRGVCDVTLSSRCCRNHSLGVRHGSNTEKHLMFRQMRQSGFPLDSTCSQTWWSYDGMRLLSRFRIQMASLTVGSAVEQGKVLYRGQTCIAARGFLTLVLRGSHSSEIAKTCKSALNSASLLFFLMNKSDTSEPKTNDF